LRPDSGDGGSIRFAPPPKNIRILFLIPFSNGPES
jgi:hypothetical protein